MLARGAVGGRRLMNALTGLGTARRRTRTQRFRHSPTAARHKAGWKFSTDNRRGMGFIPCALMPKRTDIHSVLIIGAGPIIIGQACEFDYSGTQACKALREEGYRVVLINSNPATIMTDPEFADRTYIEPITPECVEKIIVRELEEMKRMGIPVGPSTLNSQLSTPHKLVLLPTLGGQTALNTAMKLHD